MSQYEPSGPYQPYSPYPPYQPPPPWEGPPPTAVRYARNLIYVFLALSLVRLGLYIFGDEPTEIAEPLADRGADDVVTVAFAAVAAITTLFGAAIWVVAAILIIRGANWVRILVLGLFAYVAIGLLWSQVSNSIADPEDRLATELIVLDIVGGLLVLATTVLLWTRESSRFFKSGG